MREDRQNRPLLLEEGALAVCGTSFPLAQFFGGGNSRIELCISPTPAADGPDCNRCPPATTRGSACRACDRTGEPANPVPHNLHMQRSPGIATPARGCEHSRRPERQGTAYLRFDSSARR